MPRQNRVTPFGDLIAHPARGLVFGNRGCLHDARGRVLRHHRGQRWIACRPEFKGRRRTLLQPGRYTELFFLDDATALAAGHRACAECRREDFNLLLEVTGHASAAALDAQLHAERFDPVARRQRRHSADLRSLPDGAFVELDRAAWLVLDSMLRRWTPAGYTERRPRPAEGWISVITPPSSIAVLCAGWRPLVPLVHDSAGARP